MAATALFTATLFALAVVAVTNTSTQEPSHNILPPIASMDASSGLNTILTLSGPAFASLDDSDMKSCDLLLRSNVGIHAISFAGTKNNGLVQCIVTPASKIQIQAKNAQYFGNVDFLQGHIYITTNTFSFIPFNDTTAACATYDADDCGIPVAFMKNRILGNSSLTPDFGLVTQDSSISISIPSWKSWSSCCASPNSVNTSEIFSIAAKSNTIYCLINTLVDSTPSISYLATWFPQNNTVECTLPAQSNNALDNGAVGKYSVALSLSNQFAEAFVQTIGETWKGVYSFVYVAEGPKIISAIYVNGGQNIDVTFDAPVEPRSNNCSDTWDGNTINGVGKNATCVWLSNHVTRITLKVPNLTYLTQGVNPLVILQNINKTWAGPNEPSLCVNGCLHRYGTDVTIGFWQPASEPSGPITALTDNAVDDDFVVLGPSNIPDCSTDEFYFEVSWQKQKAFVQKRYTFGISNETGPISLTPQLVCGKSPFLKLPKLSEGLYQITATGCSPSSNHVATANVAVSATYQKWGQLIGVPQIPIKQSTPLKVIGEGYISNCAEQTFYLPINLSISLQRTDGAHIVKTVNGGILSMDAFELAPGAYTVILEDALHTLLDVQPLTVIRTRQNTYLLGGKTQAVNSNTIMCLKSIPFQQSSNPVVPSEVCPTSSNCTYKWTCRRADPAKNCTDLYAVPPETMTNSQLCGFTIQNPSPVPVSAIFSVVINHTTPNVDFEIEAESEYQINTFFDQAMVSVYPTYATAVQSGFFYVNAFVDFRSTTLNTKGGIGTWNLVATGDEAAVDHILLAATSVSTLTYTIKRRMSSSEAPQAGILYLEEAATVRIAVSSSFFAPGLMYRLRFTVTLTDTFGESTGAYFADSILSRPLQPGSVYPFDVVRVSPSYGTTMTTFILEGANIVGDTSLTYTFSAELSDTSAAPVILCVSQSRLCQTKLPFDTISISLSAKSTNFARSITYRYGIHVTNYSDLDAEHESIGQDLLDNNYCKYKNAGRCIKTLSESTFRIQHIGGIELLSPPQENWNFSYRQRRNNGISFSGAQYYHVIDAHLRDALTSMLSDRYDLYADALAQILSITDFYIGSLISASLLGNNSLTGNVTTTLATAAQLVLLSTDPASQSLVPSLFEQLSKIYMKLNFEGNVKRDDTAADLYSRLHSAMTPLKTKLVRYYSFGRYQHRDIVFLGNDTGTILTYCPLLDHFNMLPVTVPLSQASKLNATIKFGAVLGEHVLNISHSPSASLDEQIVILVQTTQGDTYSQPISQSVTHPIGATLAPASHKEAQYIVDVSIAFPANVQTFEVPVEITIPFVHSKNSEVYTCYKWYNESQTWSTVGVKTSDNATTCSSENIGIFGVFEMCPAGFVGYNCATACYPEHFGVNCSGYETCSNVVAVNSVSGVCDCPSNYTGRSCEFNCAEPGAIAFVGFLGFGPNCSSPVTCDGTGTSTIDYTSGNCSCNSGYSGVRCETNINDCASSPCENGATCVDQVSGYSCTCANGYIGVHCEENIDDCTVGLCFNNGTCIDDVASKSCKCPDGLTGPRCQSYCDDGFYGESCAQSCKCKNDGICNAVTGACTCIPGWTGDFCTTNSPDELGKLLMMVLIPVVVVIALLVMCYYCKYDKAHRKLANIEKKIIVIPSKTLGTTRSTATILTVSNDDEETTNAICTTEGNTDEVSSTRQTENIPDMDVIEAQIHVTEDGIIDAEIVEIAGSAAQQKEKHHSNLVVDGDTKSLSLSRKSTGAYDPLSPVDVDEQLQDSE